MPGRRTVAMTMLRPRVPQTIAIHMPQVPQLARLDPFATVDALEAPVTAAGGTAAGDERRLRGIPAVGRGCAGAIAGTRPDSALLSRERRRGQ